MDSAFVDTNILVYLFDTDAVSKRDDAWTIFDEYKCYISIQVAMEFCSVCGRRLKMTKREIDDALDMICSTCTMQTVTPATVRQALDVRERYGYSFYDSVMIASALELGCNYLFSEDMRHRHKIDKTMILNIFAEYE